MKPVFIVINALILLPLGLLLGIAILAVDGRPAVPLGLALSATEIEEVQQLLIDHDPRLLLDEDDQIVVFTETEVNALIAYAAANILEPQRASGRARLEPGRAILQVSTEFSVLPFGNYLNVTAEFRDRERLRLDSLQVGELRLPRQVLAPLAAMLHPLVKNQQDYQLLVSLLATVERVAFEESLVRVEMDWRDEHISAIGERARRLFIDEEEEHRLADWYGHVAAVSDSLAPTDAVVGLQAFLGPLFAMAADASREGADPVAENRALFIAMAIYLNELDLEQLLGPAEGSVWPSPRPLRVRVAGRSDLPQHIVSAAAISASAGVGIADILSVYKEVHDSRYRTGFSFSDLTANQVGAALGELATASREHALLMQDFMASAESESDYMPAVERFDGITEQEFINRYEDRASESYQARLKEIDAAIQERPLFRAFRAPLRVVQEKD